MPPIDNIEKRNASLEHKIFRILWKGPLEGDVAQHEFMAAHIAAEVGRHMMTSQNLFKNDESVWDMDAYVVQMFEDSQSILGWSASFVWNDDPKDSRWFLLPMTVGRDDEVMIETGSILRHQRDDFDGDFDEHDPDGHTAYSMEEFQYIDVYGIVAATPEEAVDAGRDAIVNDGRWPMLGNDPVFPYTNNVWVGEGDE